jgi:hypothetical protein
LLSEQLAQNNGRVLTRRLRQIAQVPIGKRFGVLAAGMEMLAESVATLETDASTLGDSRRHRGAAVLRGFADEEAAKVLILLDLARAGWKDNAALQACVFAFYNHLARGLYVKAYEGRPADLGEVRRYVDSLRPQFYLDGPMDVDWIFGNEVLTTREEQLYVDYIEDEHGDRRWTGPADRAAVYDDYDIPERTSAVVRLVAAMKRAGLLTEAGLAATRTAWDGVRVHDAMRWSKLRPLNVAVIEKLIAGGHEYVTEDDRRSVHYVCEHWIFPMTSLDLKMAVVDHDDLKRERELWMAHEMGVPDEVLGVYGA